MNTLARSNQTVPSTLGVQGVIAGLAYILIPVGLLKGEVLDYEGINCYDATLTGFTGVIRAEKINFPNTYTVDRMLTPTVDGLAEEGVIGTNYYCVSAICTPPHYSILTGRYPERNPHFCQMYPAHTQANIFFNIRMTRDVTNLAKVLQEHGYATGVTDKWHNFPEEVKIRLVDIYIQIPQMRTPGTPG